MDSPDHPDHPVNKVWRVPVVSLVILALLVPLAAVVIQVHLGLLALRETLDATVKSDQWVPLASGVQWDRPECQECQA